MHSPRLALHPVGTPRLRDTQKTGFARYLRSSMTDAEQALWRRLRKRQLAGCRFRRQHPIGPFIVDFACIEKKLAIEVDGGQHSECEADVHRDELLRARGFTILRFWNNEVLENIEGVCDVILRHLTDTHPHPGLPPQAGEGDRRKSRSNSLPCAAGEGWGGGPAFRLDAPAPTHPHPGLAPHAGEGEGQRSKP
jgi:very-short-patch-repair endonuclease